MSTHASEPQSLLRWVFHHEHHTLTCSVTANGAAGFDVCVVPHWNLSAAIVQRCDHAAAAFALHAEIAIGLRRKGWVVMEHGSTRRAA